MDRRRFISIADGAGLGLLIPYAIYRSLSYGFGSGGGVNVEDYEQFGPQAALRAITPADQFSYDEVRKLAAYETTLTLECISNEIAGPLIGNANWTGTLLRPLLDRVKLKANAKFAIFYAADG